MPRIPVSINAGIAFVLILLSFGVYLATSSPTINFWDCGEFVATAYGLGIPHQPGTPLYVLVGRVFAILPMLGLSVAQKINLMSAFFAALAVGLSYLTITTLVRGWRDEREDPMPVWIRRGAAASGALFLAFSSTFWINAIEAEVYSIASFVLALTAYLSIRWYESRDREAASTLLLIIIYSMGLAVGFHLGALLVFPGVFLLVLTAKNKALRSIDLIIVAAAMGSFMLSAVLKVGGPALALFVAACLMSVWRLLTWGSKEESAKGAYFALVGIALFVLGLSVHFVMMIRAGQQPFINQSQPETFEILMSVLRREQYPPRSMFLREAPLLWQLGHMWGSSVWQAGTSLANNRCVGYLQQFTMFPKVTPVDAFLPMALWLFGLVSQFAGNRRLFISFATHLFFNSIFLVLFLNFNDHEVRDRDYFYFGFFQFLSLFMGLGVAGFLRLVWQAVRANPPMRWLPAAGVALFVLLPTFPVLMGSSHSKFFEHDRSENKIARNYAYNILIGLPEDSILFTNGDNDTFPLWYLQDVEGIRRDVRVVNLSLINLPWYIRQLRDIEPKMPITLTDGQIEGRDYMVYRDWQTRLLRQELPNGEIAWVRDIVVWHMVRNNNWNRPMYYAVTVPNENIGQWQPFLDMEGLIFRITPEASPDGLPTFNSETIWKNFTEVYDFESVLDADGTQRTDIYRNHNSSHLLNNYPVALCRVAYTETLAGNYERGIEAAEMAYRFNPIFPLVVEVLPLIYLQAGYTAKGVEAGNRLYDQLGAQQAIDMSVRIGEALLTLRQDAEALEWAASLIERQPDEPAYVQLLAQSHLLSGDQDAAVQTLEDWVARTGDPNARRELEVLREEIRRAGAQDADSSEVDGP